MRNMARDADKETAATQPEPAPRRTAGGATRQLVLEQLERKLDVQSDAFDRLDAKLQQVVGFVGVLITIALAVSGGDRRFTSVGGAVAVVAVLCLLVALM